jgi:hypothetical protein
VTVLRYEIPNLVACLWGIVVQTAIKFCSLLHVLILEIFIKYDQHQKRVETLDQVDTSP